VADDAHIGSDARDRDHGTALAGSHGEWHIHGTVRDILRDFMVQPSGR
jgi:hypothetical protein